MTIHRTSQTLLTVLLLALVSQVASADVQLHGLFMNHMVIQRDTEVPIWGWAEPGEAVTIKASWGGDAKAVTRADGAWRAILKTPPAGGPFQIEISGRNTVVLRDVLSGDVWLCTGQSNMDHALAKFVNDSREPRYQPLVDYIRREVATVNDPWLRHIEVPQTPSLFKGQTNFHGTWISANPEQVGAMTATGYFFAREIRRHVNVPIGLLECSWGGTRIQPWLPESAYMADRQLKGYLVVSRAEVVGAIARVEARAERDADYQAVLKQWQDNGRRGPKPLPSGHPGLSKQQPTTLYNGMISAIVPCAIKGAVWYQGEGNSRYLEDQYGLFLRHLITSWRGAWKQGDFPFYFTQLAAYKVSEQRQDLGWATVNDQMRSALALPRTGMAVLYDLGEPADVHPHNKMDTGKRLALWALKHDYGIDVPEVSGPLYKSARAVDGRVRVTFDHVGSGLMAGCKVYLNDAMPVDMPLTWFEIRDPDGQWHRARARIVSRDTVEVWHPDITSPKGVRYAWSSNPEGANLYNKEGLPAAVFSTEN